MERYTNTILNKQGKPVAGAVVTVTTYPGNEPATIYAADGGQSVKSVTSDQNGRFAFYAADGHYNLSISGKHIDPFTITDIVLNDPNDDLSLGALQPFKDDLDALQLPDYAALRAYKGPRKSVYVTGAGIAGMFVRDDADTTSADNGGTVIVTAGGKRFKRVFDGAVDVRWFGAKGDGVADDTLAIRAACATGKWVFVPSGTYRVTDWLLHDSEALPDNDDFTLHGEGQGRTIIDATGMRGVLFGRLRSRISVRDIHFKDASKTAIAFKGAQAGSSYWDLRNITFDGMAKHIEVRRSLWITLSNINSHSPSVGGIDFTDKNYDGSVPTGGWNNWVTGWFNNQIVLNNVKTDGGPFGIRAVATGLVLNSCTTQGHSVDGLLLDAPEPGVCGAVLNGFYAEFCSGNSLNARNQVAVIWNGGHVQGGSHSAPGAVAVRGNAAKIYMNGVGGFDYFVNKVHLSNGTVLTGQVPGVATVAANGAVIDSTSQWLANGSEERFVQHYEINKPNGVIGEVYVIPLAMPDFSVYDIDIIASEDGYLQRRAAYKVSRYTGAYTPVIDLTAGVAGPWTLAAVDTNAEITFTGSGAVVMHLIVRRLSDISSSTVALAPK